jgi:hypothetical protein
MSFPAEYWTWERWMHGHGEFREFGPKSGPHRPPVPKPAPLKWRLRHLRYHLVTPPPPPRSPFAGIGMFTAHDPLSVLRFKGKIDWVLLKADGGDRADPAHAGRLRAEGFRVGVWEADNSHGQDAVDDFRAELYVAQDEGPGQREAARRHESTLRVAKALVTNNWAPDWPAGWSCLPEAYLPVNPNATPGRVVGDAWARGARDISPVFEFEEGGVRYAPAAYFKHWTDRRNWVGYLCEQLRAGEL